MKLYVKVNNGSWHTLPCNDGSKQIAFIVNEMKTRLGLTGDAQGFICQTRVKNGEMSKLNVGDQIKDVLQDGDFVYIGK